MNTDEIPDDTGCVLTLHAEQRSQQRAVSKAHIDAAIAWGRPYYQRQGRVAYFLGRKEAQLAGAVALKNTVVVVGPDGVIITTIRTDNPRRLRKVGR